MPISPVVSVVIPTYNQSLLLRETLDSVFAQTFSEYEVVVVNDGSTDETAERLRPLAEAGRIRLVNQPNGGIGAARNRGLEEARGKYVALLDHDDLWRPGKLAAQVAFLEAHPECAMVSVPWAFSTTPQTCRFDPRVVRNSDGIVERPLYQLSRGQLILISSSVLFDRAKAAGLRYETVRDCPEDVTFQIGLFTRGACGIVGDEILMIYRIHAGSYSSQASYLDNGLRLLRRRVSEGQYAALDARGRGDCDLFIAHLARMAVLTQLVAGQRWRGLQIYLREFGGQIRRGRLKYLVAFWLLLCLPVRVVRLYWSAKGLRP